MMSNRARGVAYLVSLIVVLLVRPAGASLSPWPQWHADAKRSGDISLPVDIEHPGIRWSFSAGGRSDFVAADLDGDGTPEVLLMEGGRIVARTVYGAVLWDTPPLGARRIVAVEDLDGDGAAEVVVDAVNSVVLLPALTGCVDATSPDGCALWQTPSDLNVENLGTVLVEDVRGGPLPDLLVADGAANAGKPELTGRVYVFSFDGGFGDDAPAAATAEGTRDYEAGLSIALADVDGDGRREIVAPGWHHVYAYDADTGALKWASEDLEPTIGDENLYLCDVHAADVDGDGAQELFVFTENVFVGTPSRRVVALDFDGAALALLWTDAAPPGDGARHVWPRHPLADVDGDGHLDVVSSVWTQADGWTTRVRDARDGHDVLGGSVAGMVHAVVDPDGDGHADVALWKTVFPSPRRFPDLTVVHFEAGGPAQGTEIFAAPGARLVLPPDDTSGLTLPGMLVEFDADGDDWGSVLQWFDYPGGQPGASLTLQGAALAARFVAGSSPLSVAVAYADGVVALYDAAFGLLNDADGDGRGDLVLGGYLVREAVAVSEPDTGTPLVVVPAAGGRLIGLDATSGTATEPPAVAAQAGAALPQLPVAFDAAGGAAMLVFDRDASLNLVARAVALSDGQPLWQQALGGKGGVWLPMFEPLVLDSDGDGTDEVYLTVRDTEAGQVFYLLRLDGDGTLVWVKGPIETPGGNIGFLGASGDGSTLYLPENKTLVARSTATGEEVASVPLPQTPAKHWYGVPVIYDIDGDGQTEVVLFGTTAGVLAFEEDLTPIWQRETGAATRMPGTVVATDAGPVAVATRTFSPWLDFVAAGTGDLLTSVALVGGQVYTDPDALPDGAAKAWVRDVVAAPDGPGGQPAVLATASDGFVYALRADGSLVWAFAVGADAGTVAAIDADGDQRAELVIPLSDGRVVVLDEAPVGAPAWVRENDCTGPALSDAEDIDQQEDCTRICANWAPVEGATGYSVDVRSAFGTLIASLPDAGPDAQATIDGLSLQLGVTYRVFVRALTTADDGSPLAGVPASSDGVVPVDLSPPSIESFAAEPPSVVTDENGSVEATTLHGVAHDGKAIETSSVWIEDASGTTVWSVDHEPKQRDWELMVTWEGLDSDGQPVAPGTYTAHWRVVDPAGGSDEATADIAVCRAPAIYDADKGACVVLPEPDAGVADAGGEPDGGLDAGTGQDAAADAGAVPDAAVGPADVPGGGDVASASTASGGCGDCASGGGGLPGLLGWLMLVGAWAVLRRRFSQGAGVR